MPPNYRGGGANGGRGTAGALTRTVEQRDAKMKETLEDMRNGIVDLAKNLGMEEDSVLDKAAHKRLAAQVQELAAMDAKLEIKRAATASALKALAAKMDARAATGSGVVPGGPDELAPEEMDVSHFLDGMKDTVASAMEGADEKALESKEYKNLMKSIAAPDDDEDDDDIVIQHGTQVSLKCPLSSTTIVDPVRSKTCGHTFGRKAIYHHISVAGRNAGGASCPIAGCSHKVSRGDLVVDKDMARRLRIESNTQPTPGPGDDAEEIDDEEIGESHI